MSSGGAAGAAGAASTAAANAVPSTPSAPTVAQSSQNLNNIVIEYLSKKGYTKTEAMLRAEMASVDSDGRPIRPKEDKYAQFDKAYNLLRSWIENSLDLYKPELKRILFPIFVHIYLSLIRAGLVADAKRFAESNDQDFKTKHSFDLRNLYSINAAHQVEENDVAKLYTENKYHVTLTATTHNLLMLYLNEYTKQGGEVVISILNTNVQLNKVERPPSFGFFSDDDMMGDNEGIPGHISKDGETKELPNLKLGMLPMDKDLIADVEDELSAEDAREKERREGELGATTGPTYLETFQQHIKREESEDTPMRDDVPLPPYKQTDIDAEVRSVKEYRDRYRLTTISATAKQTPGLEGPTMTGALPSVLTYTFHNTNDNMHRVAFSQDSTLCAGSFAESYIRVWSLKGEKLQSVNQSENEDAGTSRRYIGHSGAVYGVSFSPDANWLLSSSDDKSVRLWSLQTHTAMVSYRGHDSPVWDVAWGPFGYYFATASHDHTARMWSTEHIAPLRIFVGHLDDVNRVAWHPNSAYVVTGSQDKTLRMWDIQQGASVRLFNGHTAPVRCQEVSPNGKYIASGADDGTISIWDIGMGRRIKTMRGHARVPIWSLSWSVEGQILVSGAADNTIRVWSVGEDKGNNAANSSGTVGAEMVINGIGGLPGDGTTKVDGTAGGAAGLGVLGAKGRKDKKEVVAT
ncbi:Xenin [Dactylella cylindrospora]|nr:Xenin [Dactylella cylindrospora]